MQILTNQAAGQVTRSRTAVAAFAAIILVGGTATEASARSGHHHHHRHHHHLSSAATAPTGWREANASIFTTSAIGRLFSGMASYYGSESGSKTASGQRFNQNAMTCAHRSLPFGTKLRVNSWRTERRRHRQRPRPVHPRPCARPFDRRRPRHRPDPRRCRPRDRRGCLVKAFCALVPDIGSAGASSAEVTGCQNSPPSTLTAGLDLKVSIPGAMQDIERPVSRESPMELQEALRIHVDLEF